MNIELTPKDLNCIIQALLFSSSVSVGADWDKEDCEAMLNLAKQIKNTINKEDLNLENLNFFKEDYYEDSCSEEILKEFEGSINIVSLEYKLEE